MKAKFNYAEQAWLTDKGEPVPTPFFGWVRDKNGPQVKCMTVPHKTRDEVVPVVLSLHTLVPIDVADWVEVRCK